MQSTQVEQPSEGQDGVMAKNAPKAKRKIGDSNITANNKAVKSTLKSGNVKSDTSAHVAVNKSGGSKPFSKKTFMPQSPSVPVKGKKK
jgi:hypothetical protein